MRTLLLLTCLATPAAADVPRVVTDIAPVQSLAAAVLGDLGTPGGIVQPGSSPHGGGLTPTQARALSRADLVVWVGPSLSPWLADPVATLAEDAVRLQLDQTVPVRLTMREGAALHDHGDEAHAHGDEAHAHGDNDHTGDASAADDHEDHAGHDHGSDDHAESDHAHEDDHDHDDHDHDHDGHEHDDHAHAVGGVDPHLWLDPVNGIAALTLIAEELARLDPQNAATYRANAAAAAARIGEVQAGIAQILAPVADAGYVVQHDAYQYFEARFGLRPLAAIADADETAPGPARLRAVRAEATAATCLFVEPQTNLSLVETVREGRTLRTAVLDPTGADLPPGPDLYPALLDAMASAMAQCLAPR